MKSVILAAAALAVSSPAGAATVRAQDPQSLVKALQAAGYQAQLGADSDGDPMISSAASGSKFKVLFYGCTSNKDCTNVQFYAGYKVEKAATPALLNQFNFSKRFVRAMIDKENDPILTFDLDLDRGGMSDALFVDNLEVWAAILPDFERAIGFRS